VFSVPRGIPNVRYPGDVKCHAAKLPRVTDDCHVKRLAVPDKHAELVTKKQEIFAERKGRVGCRRITLAFHQQG